MSGPEIIVKKVSEASDEEIQLAAQFQGLEVAPGDTRRTLLSKLEQVGVTKEIRVFVMPAAPAVPASAGGALVIGDLRIPAGSYHLHPTETEVEEVAEIVDGEHVTTEKGRYVMKKTAPRPKIYVGIRIAYEDKPGGKDHVFTSVNGVRYDIPRNRDVHVPLAHVADLANAITKTYAETENGLGEPTQTTEYPFQFHSFAPDWAVAA